MIGVEVYSIATAGTLSRLTHEVRNSLDPLRGIVVSLERQSINPYSFLVCSVQPSRIPGDEENLALSLDARHRLAGAVAEAIILEAEGWYLDRILKRNYGELGPEDRAGVQATAIPLVYSAHTEVETARRNWRAMITEEVDRFLTDCDHLNIRGFLTFRLKPLCKLIESAAEQAVNRFLLDREYDEFIRLLKYFVDVQEPRETEVHVVVQPQGAFRIYNHEKTPIDRRYLGGYASELVSEECEYGDLLISVLITISPSRVVIHRAGEVEVAKTVASVFEDRVRFCEGCDWCGGGW